MMNAYVTLYASPFVIGGYRKKIMVLAVFSKNVYDKIFIIIMMNFGIITLVCNHRIIGPQCSLKICCLSDFSNTFVSAPYCTVEGPS